MEEAPVNMQMLSLGALDTDCYLLWDDNKDCCTVQEIRTFIWKF